MLPPKYKLSGTNDCAHKCHKIPRKAAINSLLSNALKRMYASELSIIANWLENLQKKYGLSLGIYGLSLGIYGLSLGIYGRSIFIFSKCC